MQCSYNVQLKISQGDDSTVHSLFVFSTSSANIEANECNRNKQLIEHKVILELHGPMTAALVSSTRHQPKLQDQGYGISLFTP